MNINTDYVQYKALAEHDAKLEDKLNGMSIEDKYDVSKESLKALQEGDLHNET